MAEYSTFTAHLGERISRITLARPRTANAMDLVMVAELADVAARCAASDTKVIVLDATGRFFCAGGDLGDFAAATDRSGHIKVIADTLHRAVSTLARTDAVVIVGVNGVAAGAGLSLVAGADIVVAAESATFTMAYTRVGLSPDGAGSYYLPRLIGLRRTQELMLTNRTLTATEALEWGIVTEVVPDNELAKRLDTLAEHFAQSAKQSNTAVKKLLLATFGNGLEEQMELEAALIAHNAGSPDGHEGVNAFLAKRAARYR
ncbi:enoyl-CoA hydratase [Mycobacterium sp. Root265]|uniref:enoyl-CoA hydratase/isomerase family protein n=1 Tax=Mycobacterium sp. Root265 TaxID=1736504 RepID=UPI00070E29B7|nr:enoyl-CoA hydratase-related protein [Mycobacterium sp. Root265]KRD05733.1 enoyl-CoA hydratase [Mycobacterium sp. Root265]